MSFNSEKAFIMSSDELAVLLAGKDIKNTFVLQGFAEEMDKNSVCMAMSHLYEKGFIHNIDGVFQVENELDDILKGIKDADSWLLLRNSTKSKYTKIIYCGKQSVCMEQSNTDAAAIRLYNISETEIKESIIEDFQYEEQEYHKVLDEDNIINRVLQITEVLDKGHVDQLPNTIGIIENVKCKNDYLNHRIVILQKEDAIAMFYNNRESIVEIPYNEETFVELIENVLQGETV